MQVVTKFLADLSVTTAKLAALAVTTAKIAANAVTGAQFRLNNAENLRARNAANSADINLVQVDASDLTQAQGQWHFNALAPQSSVAPTVGNDLTNKTYVDAQTSNGANKTLSNLTNPVAFNQNLLPGGDNTFSVGSTTERLSGVATTSLFNNLAGSPVVCADGLSLNNAARVTNVLNPVAAQDVATKNYTDTQEALDLRLDGSRPMTGALDMGTHLIDNVVDPVSPQDAATKNYVDNAIVGATVTGGYENPQLSAGDITNQYFDLAELVKPNTLHFAVSGVVQSESGGSNPTPDYSLSTVAGVTRVTFLNDLATGGASALVAGDLLDLRYLF